MRDDRRVFKYTVPVDGGAELSLPLAARIVHVAAQNGYHEVQFWAETRDTGYVSRRRFAVYPTGAELDEGVEYVGTAVAAGGALVWHLYEVTS